MNRKNPPLPHELDLAFQYKAGAAHSVDAEDVGGVHSPLALNFHPEHRPLDLFVSAEFLDLPLQRHVLVQVLGLVPPLCYPSSFFLVQRKRKRRKKEKKERKILDIPIQFPSQSTLRAQSRRQ